MLGVCCSYSSSREAKAEASDTAGRADLAGDDVDAIGDGSDVDVCSRVTSVWMIFADVLNVIMKSIGNASQRRLAWITGVALDTKRKSEIQPLPIANGVIISDWEW